MLPSSVFLFFIPLVSSFPHYGGLNRQSDRVHRSLKAAQNESSIDWDQWKPAGKGEDRSSCPILNSFANHEFIPRDGRNITAPVFLKAIRSVLNFDEENALNSWKIGLSSNPNPNATYFNLEMLQHTHNVFEHDGSISRRDIVFDPSNAFHEPTFSNFLSYLGNDTLLNITNMANARARHAYDMSKLNPGFFMPAAGLDIVMGELVMLLSVFGDPEGLVAKREYVEYMYRNERFPVALGWSMSKTPIGPNLKKANEAITKENPTDVPLAFTPSPTPTPTPTPV